MTRATRWLVTDVLVSVDLRGWSHEAIGAAFLIVCWEAAGHQAADDEHMMIVSGLRPRRWRTLRDQIVEARAALRKASMAKAVIGRRPLSKGTRDRIFRRDGLVCRYCGDTDGPFHIDHVIPVARGGLDKDDNLCVACATCNFKKSASLNSEWAW